jgi:hypothetical protein
VQFEAGDVLAESVRFGVGRDILWHLTKPLAAERLRRVWDRAGATEGERMRVLLALVAANSREEPDPEVRHELARGGDWLRGRSSRAADDVAGSEARQPAAAPEIELAAGYLYARCSEALGDVRLLRRGEAFWREHAGNPAGATAPGAVAAMLLSEVGLHVATFEPRYLASAERCAALLLGDDPASVAARWPATGGSIEVTALAAFAYSLTDNPLTPRVKEALGAFLDARVEVCSRDPFGVPPPGGAGALADAVRLAAEGAFMVLGASRATSRDAYVEMGVNALNWLMGLNPWGRCLLRGAGLSHPTPEEPGRPPGSFELPDDPAGDAGLEAVAAYLGAIALA